jgi:predicted lactoylglutathione lyase
MNPSAVVVSLPISDRRTSFRFYGEGLGFSPVGEPAEDGVPEPLQFELEGGARLMLVPTGGFGWVIGDHSVAEPGQSECVLSFAVAGPAEVDAFVERARAAGARIVAEPAQQPWGYVATFADPDAHLWMVTVP